jgi:hypothetical protein
MTHGSWELETEIRKTWVAGGRSGLLGSKFPLHGFGDHNKLRDLCVLVSSPVKWEE